MKRLSDERTILLFFGEPGKRERGPLALAARRWVRPMYKRLRGQPTTTGFHVAFERLRLALVRAGYRVRADDERLARDNPTYPVGLAGYPCILDAWTLPNPAVLGPGLLDHPAQAPALMRDPRFRKYIVPCGWMEDLFRPTYGQDALVRWFAGLDLARWEDTRAHPKTLDLLVYDKILFDRDRKVPALLEPLLAATKRRGLRVEVLRYGQYRPDAWRRQLARSRGLVFLCEHETQGMAYQEALASNVPLLAWDGGEWLDPRRAQWVQGPVPASSVPFFSPECGERFRGVEDFEPVLDVFLGRLGTYTPRAYAERELSLARSAELYARAYGALVPGGWPGAEAPPHAPVRAMGSRR